MEYSSAWKLCRCCPSYQCSGPYYNIRKHEYWSDEWCDWMEDVYHGWLDSLEPYERAKEKGETALYLFLGMTEMVPEVIIESQIDKETIREIVVLSEVVAQSTEIREVGKNKYQARCPFHDDRLASLSINDERGLWYCFAGCGGGDIFSWIMKQYDLDFRDAIQIARKLI